MAAAADRNNTAGWLTFKLKDKERLLPSFMNSGSHTISYGYGYRNITPCTVGAGSFRDIYHCLKRFTPENATERNDQRGRVLQVSFLVFAETQRFVQMQKEALQNIQEGTDKGIYHLDTLIHDWVNVSRARACKADQAAAPEAAVVAAAPESSSKIVDSGLRLVKYRDDYILPLIKRQQMQAKEEEEQTQLQQGQQQQHKEEKKKGQRKKLRQKQQALDDEKKTPRGQRKELQRQLLQLRRRQLKQEYQQQQARNSSSSGGSIIPLK
uniref:Uncharacterized protein n=1 Tax=Leersia perrieri TaxID=77586 RepID=A0A0D9XVW8_9ORYZ